MTSSTRSAITTGMLTDIRRRRTALRLTQPQLAALAGVSFPLLRKLDDGTYQATNSPKRERVLQMLDQLESEGRYGSIR